MPDSRIREVQALNGEQRIRQANALAKSGQELDLLEKRLLLIAMARIKSTDVELLTHRICISEIVDAFGSNPYQRVQRAARGLMRSMVYVMDGEGGFTEFQWTTLARYVPAKNSEIGESYIEIRLNEELSPLLLQLREKYNSIPLFELLPMKSFNAQRLYEVLWHDSHGGKKLFLTYEMADLKWQLGLRSKTSQKGRTLWNEKYKAWRDFKKVLQRAQMEFEEHGRLRFTFEGITKGRAVSLVRFNLKFVESVAEIIPPNSEGTELARSSYEIEVGHQLESHGYTQDPFVLIDTYGVEVVAYAIKLAEKAQRSSMITKNPIRNLPGFIHDLLVKGIALRQLEQVGNAEIAPPTDPREVAANIRTSFDIYREETAEALWQSLDEDTRTSIPAMMAIEFRNRKAFTLETLEKVGWEGPYFRSARNTYLLEQYADELPDDVIDVHVFINNRNLLEEQPEKVKAIVLQELEDTI